jgi:hypothetical protein
MAYFGVGSQRQLRVVLAAQGGTSSTQPVPIPMSVLGSTFLNLSREDGGDILPFDSNGNPITKVLQRFSKTGPTGWIWLPAGVSTSQKTIYLETGSGNAAADNAATFTNHGILRFPDLSVAAGAFTDMCGIGNLNDIGTLIRGDYTQPGGFPGISGFSSSKYGEIADADDLSHTSGYPNDRAGSILTWAKIASWGTQGIFCKAGTIGSCEWAMYMASQTDFRNLDWNGTAYYYCGRTGNPGVSLGTWFQMIGTYSGGKTSASHKFYINDTQKDSANLETTYGGVTGTTAPVMYGGLGTGSGLIYPMTGGVLSLGIKFSTDLSATTGLISSWYNWLNSPAGQIISVTDTTPTSGYPYPPIQLLMDCCAL